MGFLRNEFKLRRDSKSPLNYKISPGSPAEIILHQQRTEKENRKCLADMTHSMSRALQYSNRLAEEQINSVVLG